MLQVRSLMVLLLTNFIAVLVLMFGLIVEAY